MAFKHYTRCFAYPAGGKPYNEKDRPAFLVGQLLKTLVTTVIAAGVGALAGPVGAIVAAVVAYFGSVIAAIDKAADEWLFHRLVCLGTDPLCAVGVVSYDPFRSDLGAFDNDQYFNIVLMPHPTASVYNDEIKATGLAPANRYDDAGKVVPDDGFDKHVADHPKNDILHDGFQGQALLTPRSDLQADLGYEKPSDLARSTLHCEAEGDFWVKMKQWAPAIAVLLTTAVVVTVAGAAAGAAGGAALGCAIGGIFGPIGCLIGGIIGGIIGAIAGGAAAGAIAYYGGVKPVLQALFDADPGNVEDANVGDAELGPISMGDHVAVLGEHVYDGYHTGWHEFHPLMAVVKFDHRRDDEAGHYLMWQPSLPDSGTVPPKPPGETVDLTVDDVRKGLESDAFRTRCEHLKDAWCRMLQDAFSEHTRTQQQGLDQRWTIHPAVDGCLPREPTPTPSTPAIR